MGTNKKIILWELIGIGVAILLGVIMHFAFDWIGRPTFLAGCFPINESVWEHSKLAFIPLIEFGILEYFFVRKDAHNFITAKAAGATAAALLTIILYYVYTAFTDQDVMAVNIIIFCLSIIIGQLISYILLTRDPIPKGWEYISAVWIIAVIVLFFVFAFNPPHRDLFYDLQGGFYGLKKEDLSTFASVLFV